MPVYSGVAQWPEQVAVNHLVVGSNPTPGATRLRPPPPRLRRDYGVITFNYSSLLRAYSAAIAQYANLKDFMYYVYVLSQKDNRHYYVGYTADLSRRLKEHCTGLTRSTRGRSWKLLYYFATSSKFLAEQFECYLKTGSGRAFCKRHFESKYGSSRGAP